MCICELMETTYFKDLSIAIIGAGIGVYGAWYFFRQTLENDKIKEEQKRKIYLLNRLKWTKELLKDVIKQANDQADKYIEQGNEIKANPYKIHFVQLLASNQMERLQSIDSQDLFDAFIDQFGDNIETVKKYKDFLSKIDFISKSLEMTFNWNDRNIQNLGQDQEKLRLLIDTFYSHFLSLKNSSESIPVVEAIMSRYWKSFQDYIGSGPVDLQKLNNDFLVPLFNEVKAVSSENNVSSGHIIVPLRDITTLMHHVAINNTHYADDTAIVLKANIQEPIAFLETLLNDLEGTPKGVSNEAIDDIVLPIEN